MSSQPPLAHPGAPARRAGTMMAAGAGAAFVGLLLPWLSVSFSLGRGPGASISRSGMATDDGKIVLVAAIALGALAAPFLTGRAQRVKALAISALVLSAIVTVVGVVDTVDITGRVGAVPSGLSGVRFRAGFGLYLTTAGGVASLVGSVMALRVAPAASPAAALPYDMPPPAPDSPPTSEPGV